MQISIILWLCSVLLQAGKLPPDNTVGRSLMDLVSSVPQMSQTDFESMLNSNMQVHVNTKMFIQVLYFKWQYIYIDCTSVSKCVTIRNLWNYGAKGRRQHCKTIYFITE